MPTPMAQSKIFALSPPCPCAVRVTLARTFSKIRGAPPMKVGLMTPRFSTILVRSPSTAVLKPNSSCTRGAAPCPARGTSAATGTARRRGPGCPAPRRPCPRRSSCRGPAGRPWAGRWCRRCRSGWPGPPGRSWRSAGRSTSGSSASSVCAAGWRVRPGSGCVTWSVLLDVPSNSTMAVRRGRSAVEDLVRLLGVLGEHAPPIRSRRGCRRHRPRWSTGTPWWSRRRRTGWPGRRGSTRSGWSRRSRPAAAARRRDRPGRRPGRTPGPWSAPRSATSIRRRPGSGRPRPCGVLSTRSTKQVPERLGSLGQCRGHDASSLTGRTAPPTPPVRGVACRSGWPRLYVGERHLCLIPGPPDAGSARNARLRNSFYVREQCCPSAPCRVRRGDDAASKGADHARPAIRVLRRP